MNSLQLRDVNNSGNHRAPFPFSLAFTRHRPSQSVIENNSQRQDGLVSTDENSSAMLAVDHDQALWNRVTSVRKNREILTNKFRLFVRISLLFVILILIFGVGPLHLQWWIVFIPMGFMVMSMAYVGVLRCRIRTMDREEVSLLQSMGRASSRHNNNTDTTFLPPPPPTYATAAAQPPAYINPLKTPSYVSLLPAHTRTNSQREGRSNSTQSQNEIIIEMSQV
ncbi:hypothetical protein K7432_000282 [Basidiobolus ranarum]|uniref:Transmembrane protein n=1 Tax=Basidiobolus ranarum TaxID=34480 RepID=A0ABR2WBG7_9FUNG